MRLQEQVAPAGAPEPHNDAERCVFRNLYETLVTVDCEGALAPGLAAAWSAENGGRRWVFTLREGSRFWDGRPVLASDVRESWLAAQKRGQAAGCLLPWAWLDASAASIHALDDRQLAISLPEPQPDLPYLLAHPAFAVAGPAGPNGWPVGSGPCEPVAGRAGADTFVACAPFAGHPTVRPLWRRLEFHWPRAAAAGRAEAGPAGVDVGGGGGRRAPDTLERGGGAAVTVAWDLAIVRWPRSAPGNELPAGFAAVALPWDRAYLLLQPPASASAPLAASALAARRQELAAALQEALGATALPIEGFFFRAPKGAACPQLLGPAAGLTAAAVDSSRAPSSGGRWACAADDEAAALLTARLRPAGAALDSVAAAALPLVVRDGQAAVVLPFPRCFATPCLQLAALLSSASWLQRAGEAGPGESSTAVARRLLAGAVVPLVATRPALLARAGLVGLDVSYDGAVLLARAGWASAPPSP